ncbi:MAG: internalization-like protein competence protein ComEC/Rec2, competence protein ComEC protein [Candidatus Adlerbacteria bacterium]|nr:internalization-like protein competence protein ComEC/Rec2, competence protein ComEC protein [Candidatus Adlerbacteria bacterium]
MEFLKKYEVHALFCALLLGCIFVWTTVYAQEQGRGVLTFAMLDIGQGDALFIEGPTGLQMLIDAGPNTGAVLSALARVMPLGDRTLDAVIETHPDADHMGGFIDVLDRYQVGSYISPDISKTNTVIEAVKKELAQQDIPVYTARRGMVIDLGGGAELDILYPDMDVSGYGEKTNDGSIVARLVYGETEVLLTGDAAFDTENHLLAVASTSLASDLLKVGHHGSKTSTGSAFIEAIHPELALISVGAKNSYGHPTKEALERLRAAGVPVMRTDVQGTIVCRSDGRQFACGL